MSKLESKVSDVDGFIKPLESICQQRGSTALAITLTVDPQDPNFLDMEITCFGDDGATTIERQRAILTEALMHLG